MIISFSSHLNVDLQQRGIEFSQLFRDYNNLRPALLEKMPPMQVNKTNGNGVSEVLSGLDLIETENEETLLSGGLRSTGACDSVSKGKIFVLRLLRGISVIFLIS